MLPLLSILVAALAAQDSGAAGPPPVSDPKDFDAAAHGMRAEAFDRLVSRARESESDALILWKDDRTIFETYFDEFIEPIETMSATKSVVAIAYLRLLADGRL